MAQGNYQTATITTQGIANQQSQSSLETKQGKVTKTYGTSTYVSACDVRVLGTTNDLIQVPNATGNQLSVGALVTVNYLRGNPYKPQITGFAGGGSASLSAAQSAAQSASAANSNTTASPTSAEVVLYGSDPNNAPKGLILTPGVNTSFIEVPGGYSSGGALSNGTLTVNVKVLCGTSLPSTTGYLDGTLFDLVNSYGVGLGTYRFNASLHTWELRAPVTYVNGLSGNVNLIAGSNISITPSGNNLTFASSGSSGVTSLNSLTGSLSIAAGTGITVAASGSTVTVAASGGGSGTIDANDMGADAYSLTTSLALVQPVSQAPLEIAIPSSGYYLIDATVYFAGATSGDELRAAIYDLANTAYLPPSTFAAMSATSGGHGQLLFHFIYHATGATTLQVYAANVTAARGTVPANSSAIYIWANSGALYPDPEITSFTPTYGESVSFTITGTGFTGATAVKINGTSCTSVTVVSDTEITAVSPASFTNGYVTVTTPGGTATSTATFAPTAPVSITVGNVYNTYFNDVGSASFSDVVSTSSDSTWILAVSWYNNNFSEAPSLGDNEMSLVATNSSGYALQIYAVSDVGTLTDVGLTMNFTAGNTYGCAELIEFVGATGIGNTSNFNYSGTIYSGSTNLSSIATSAANSCVLAVVCNLNATSMTAGTGFTAVEAYVDNPEEISQISVYSPVQPTSGTSVTPVVNIATARVQAITLELLS